MFTKKFKIPNLHCESCVNLSAEVLKEIDGVKDVTVDLKPGEVNLTADKEIVWPNIFNKLNEVGKTAQE